MTVNQSLTGVTVTPATATVVTNGTQQFTATGGGPVRQHRSASADVYVGGVNGGGTISSSGLFTAGSAATGGPFAVTGFLGGPNGNGERDDIGYAAASNGGIDLAKHGYAGNRVDQ